MSFNMMNYLDGVYSESHRYYHTINHINHMLRTARDYDIVLTESQWLAVLWHDSVYDAKSSTNEQDSVSLMKQKIPTSFNATVIEKAAEIIMDTKRHYSSTPDSDIVLDLDLCGLGSDWDTYCINTDNIRKEYDHLSKTEFITGRVAWIRSMLDRPSIFTTDWGRQEFERQARINLRLELIAYINAPFRKEIQ